MATLSPIGTLPDEILQHVLFYLSATDALLNVQLVSRRFLRMSNEPLLWRFFCQTQFRYWDPKHQMGKKLAGNVGDVDWKTLYLYRMKVDQETSKTLDSILSEQIRRIEKIERIGHYGYDAKDTLLRHCSTSESADDYLARR
jgi:F-box protein 21